MSDVDHVQAAAYDACCKVSPSNPLAVADEIEEAFKLLRAAKYAIRNYQYGNGPHDLAQSTADATDALLARMEKRQ